MNPQDIYHYLRKSGGSVPPRDQWEYWPDHGLWLYLQNHFWRANKARWNMEIVTGLPSEEDVRSKYLTGEWDGALHSRRDCFTPQWPDTPDNTPPDFQYLAESARDHMSRRTQLIYLDYRWGNRTGTGRHYDMQHRLNKILQCYPCRYQGTGGPKRFEDFIVTDLEHLEAGTWRDILANPICRECYENNAPAYSILSMESARGKYKVSIRRPANS